MGDSAIWVAVLTGGTAVLASWVTNRGTIRAARAQAEASAAAERVERARELRRAACLELMARAHDLGELYRKVVDARFQLGEGDAYVVRVQELRQSVREAYDPLMGCVRAVALEGPAQAASAAQAVLGAATEVSRSLWHVSRGEPGARARFEDARATCADRLEGFVDAARAAVEAT
ncbi:hypothetical protein ACJ6WF_12590 [Streptomyces sp. MMS24-I2-30]|uniref:hypothetical protein n=1 Tax=Streptomyces sp. MMS24-I2-30 TaxID=3351564 RepID=UPI003896ECBC